jgi:DNA polymerase III sliding clamp (beta) subunit (PCNA family)
MKLHSKILMPVLDRLKPVIPKNHRVLPVCECLKMDSTGFTGTNLETSINIPFPNLPEILVNFQEFYEAVKSFQGLFDMEYTKVLDPMQASTQDGTKLEPYYIYTLILSSGTQTISIQGSGIEDYPVPPEFTGLYRITMPEVRDMFGFCSTDDLKPAMNGLYVSPEGIAATDAHRLIVKPGITGCHPEFTSCILPRDSFRHLLPGTIIDIGEYNVMIHGSNRSKVICRLIDAKYPDFKNVIPQNNKYHISFNRSELIQVVTQALKSANKTTKQVAFRFTDVCEVSGIDIDYNKEYKTRLDFSTETGIEPMTFGINGTYFLDSLKVIQEPIITMEVESPNKAFVMRSGDSIILNMPVKVQEPQEA